jgi:hypothetical protein
MNIKDIQGLKWPDEYIIRFIYKEGLDKKKGKVIELGSGNGSNLVPFYSYGYDVVGVDYLPSVIKWGNVNFANFKEELGLQNSYAFYCQDMMDYIDKYREAKADILMMPGAILYLTYEQIQKLFKDIKAKKVVGHGSYLYLRMRTKQDYRYNRGRKLSEHSFKLNIKETGEFGCTMTFLNESEMIKALEETFSFEKLQVFHQDFDNVQNGVRVHNSDLILWGKLK